MSRQTIRRKSDRAFFDGLPGEFSDLSNLISGSGFFDRTFAHNVKTGSAVSHQTANIDRWPQRFEGVEIATIGFPIPGQTVQYRVLWNVFNRLHHAREKFSIGFLTRCKRNPAITQ